MKMIKLLFALLALTFLAVGSSWAHGYRSSVGVYIGGPYIGPYWGPAWGYPPPYYYPPRVIVVPQAPPPVYIEQQEAAPAASAPPEQQYWYYCGSSKAYYPYVKECPDGWQKVLPQPAR
jgi:hypothetical protein